ncbi:hypothetical protein H5410_060048 [Solanum commersonii]|uniref:Ubiquitin-like domain-containing protein n=1 Tax=Solanum commersonii TaxID=4109 RepID=A0A9J5W453_SOLCO|nr:hypothetical protein H5410_060048 [Solanum commersonii]
MKLKRRLLDFSAIISGRANEISSFAKDGVKHESTRELLIVEDEKEKEHRLNTEYHSCFVYPLADDIDVKVTITVKESDSIEHVKSLIHDHGGIPECLQQLFSKDVRLTDDEQKLMDCGIIENSTLHAYIDNSVPKVFLVKSPHANVTITVYSRTFDTIQDVKCRIGVKEGVNSK